MVDPSKVGLKQKAKAKNSMQQPISVAIEAAWKAGGVLRECIRAGVTMRSKEGGLPYDLVSDADVNSEKAIVSIIQKHFPDHEILGEEEAKGNVDAEHVWIIDPLDGTNNFAHRVPHFAVSIGYYSLGQAQCGVVLNPTTGDLYWAQSGQGAFHMQVAAEASFENWVAELPQSRKLRVSAADTLAACLIGVGFYYDRGEMMRATLAAIEELFQQQIHGVRRFGTASLDLCQVAEGRFGAFFEYKLSPWDFAAGRLIVKEAGGMVTDCQGADLPLQPSSLLASNSHVHDAVLWIVKRHWGESQT